MLAACEKENLKPAKKPAAETPRDHPNLCRYGDPRINSIIIGAWHSVQKKDFESASLDFERLLNKKYVDYDILFGAGLAFYRTGDARKASGFLDRALELRPDHFEALFLKAKILAETGKGREARRCLGEILELSVGEPLICGYYFTENDIAGAPKLAARKAAARKLLEGR